MPGRRGFLLVWWLILAVVLPAYSQEQRWQQLMEQARQLYGAGRYTEGIPVVTEAVRVAEDTFGHGDLHVAVSLSSLARMYREAGQYAPAGPLLERSVEITEKVLGPDDPHLAPILNDLAELYTDQGRYADAESLLQRALLIREKAFGPGHPEVAESLNTLGSLYYSQGRYADAELRFQGALEIWQKSLGPDHLLIATALDNLAQTYRQQGRYLEAEPLSIRAVRMLEKVAGSEHPDLALALQNLATLYQSEGKYAEAEPLYRRALDIDRKAFGEESPATANVLGNLGTLNWQQGRYDVAERQLADALRIRVKTLGPVHSLVAATLNNLARLFSDVGRYDEAEKDFKLAITIQERTLGDDAAALVPSLVGLASVYKDQHRLADAEPLYQRALRIAEKQIGPESPEVGTTLADLADLYREQGRYPEARSTLQRVLTIYGAKLGPEHPYSALALVQIGTVEAAQSHSDAADAAYSLALDIFAKRFQYSFKYMNEKERLAFLDSVSGIFPLYFSFCVTHSAEMPALRGSMYDVLLWQKGFIGQSVAALRAKIAASGDPQALALWDQLAALKQQLSFLLNNPGADSNAWRIQVTMLEAKADALEKELVRRSAALADEKRLETVTWRDVQKSLKPNEAAVEFASFRFFDGKDWTHNDYYVALIVRPDTQDAPALVVIDTKRQMKGAVQALGAETKSRGSSPLARPVSSENPQLYGLLWQPLQPYLKGVTTVYVAPDGVLNQLPLGILKDETGKLLMESYDLRTLDSTRDLLRPAAFISSRDAVVIGDPSFQLTWAQQQAALQRALKPEAGQVLLASPTPAAAPDSPVSRDLGSERGSCDPPAPGGGVLCPLPGTGKEIAAVDALLEHNNWKTALYREDTALEEVVKSIHHPRLLHVATHGFFLTDQQVDRRQALRGSGQPSGLEDPMLRSGLLFAGADRSFLGEPSAETGDDGVLTAYEASTLDLQGTELVVLSACETGLGKVEAGEGVFGLRRALHIAGAQSVMISMWSVPDTETQELMSGFYRNWLSGMDKHEALRKAQLDEREVVRKRYGKDLPYFWGAFVLVGR